MSCYCQQRNGIKKLGIMDLFCFNIRRAVGKGKAIEIVAQFSFSQQIEWCSNIKNWKCNSFSPDNIDCFKSWFQLFWHFQTSIILQQVKFLWSFHSKGLPSMLRFSEAALLSIHILAPGPQDIVTWWEV